MAHLLIAYRSAARHLRRRPRHFVLVVATLALGIGANLAIFSVARGVLLRPLPYDDPQSLAMIWRMPKDRPSLITGFTDSVSLTRQISTPAMFQEWRSTNSTLADVAAVELWQSNPSSAVDLEIANETVRLRGAQATPNFFQLLGVRPALGRAFDGDERDVVILSDGLWRRAFGADRNAIGHKLELVFGRDRQRRVFTVIGVLPKEFQFTYPAGCELWLPLPWSDVRSAPQNALRYQPIAKLREGVSLEAASAEIAGIYEAGEDARHVSARARSTIWLEPIHEYSVGRTKYALALLLAVTGLVLTICCGSVTTLFVAQGVTRRREVGVRLALGATRSRVGQQLVAESVLIGVTAAAVAMAVVWALIPAIARLLPPTMPRANEVTIDLAAVGWSTLITTIAIALTSFAPVALSASIEPATVLAANPSGTPRPATGRLRQALIGLQIGLVTLLLVVGVRLVHGFWQLSQVDLGFDSRSVITAEMRLLDVAYRDEWRLRDFQGQVMARVRALPFVTAASVTSSVPFRGVDWMRMVRPPSGGESVLANERQVDLEYFRLMGIPLLAGRVFVEADGPSAPAVAVISATLAAKLYGDGNPIGQTLDARTPATVIGVVADVRTRTIESAPNPAYYLHWPQNPTTVLCLVIKTDRQDAQTRDAIIAIVRSLAPGQPIQQFATLESVVAETIADRRFFGVATTALALVTLILAATAVFGVHVVNIAERTREFGIRASVGATPGNQVGRLMLAGLVPILGGATVGAVGAWWSTQLIQRYVFAIGSTSAFLFAAVTLLVVILGAVACLVPALRIAHLDIARALKTE